jgi:uncharacterized LabA/DUF88 family protein
MTSRVEEGRCRVDRCALFVDARYILADGATAVHGTSSRDSVSWDYAGLLRFLASLSADRTGQQLLRCYWYEAMADGRRTPDHDTLADLPGLTLRLGRREGVETDIHRDLSTLARNRAISDVLLVSAEEDLAQVIADVQDLGIRVMIAHISVDGNWTVSRTLRQQCDDVVQIDGTQLQPYVELIVGAEPARYDEPYTVGVYGGKPLANGHAASAGGGGHPGLPSSFTESHPAPPAIHAAPVVTGYQPPPLPPAGPPPEPSPSAPAAGAGASEPGWRGMHRSRAAGESSPIPASQPLPGPPLSGPYPGSQTSPAQTSEPQAGQAQAGQAQAGQAQAGQAQTGQPQIGQSQAGQPQTSWPGPPLYAEPDPGSFRDPVAPALPDSPPAPPAQNLPPARHGAPASAPVQDHPGPAAGSLPSAPASGQAAADPYAVAPPPASGRRARGPRPPYAPSDPGPLTDPAAGTGASAPPAQFTGSPPSLPARRGGPANGLYSDIGYEDARHADGRHENGLPVLRSPQPRPGLRDPRAARPVAGTDYIPQQGSYDAQLPVPSTAGRALAEGSLAGTAEMAHSEGLDFGKSVAHDAPALWLEAVLARKPRMPSDLETRLLEGSALPIDALLHDEVRQALRRGFWDALERSRR